MELRRCLNIYFHFVKNSLIAQMEFKANFIISILTECGFLIAKSLYIIVIFSAGLPIYGLEPKEMLMFIGSYTLITGIMDAVWYPNINSIPEYIRSATLDIYLTKPINSLFMVAFRYFNIGYGIPNVLGGIVMIIVSWSMSGIECSLTNILGYILFTLIGVILTFPILLIPATFSFWMVQSDSLMHIVFAMWDFNNMPMTIYNRIIKMVGVFLLPIFVLTNFAPMYVMGILPFHYMVYAFIAIPIFLGIAIKFWNFAIKQYSSASC